MYSLIKVGTVTNAERARYVLRNNGINAYVTRIKNPAKGDGCGYAVKVLSENVNRAIALIDNERIYVRGVDEA